MSNLGWIHDPNEVSRVLSTLPIPLFADTLRGTGQNKDVLLYTAFKDINNGSYIDYPAQGIGDCVSQGTGHGIDLLEAIQITLGKKKETFHQICTEALYGMARVDIGGLHGSREDGAVGAWAAKAASVLGVISRDVTGPYDPRRAKDWGANGVPANIKLNTRKLKTVSLVKTYTQLENSLANGYPVTVCSNQGFTMKRDRQGFCAPQGQWGHCMLICGIRIDRPGACIFQSWGFDVPAGPIALDQPPNSFWADRSIVQSMLNLNDSWSLSNFDGYPAQENITKKWDNQGFA